MAEWLGCSIGDLCDTISDTYKGNDDRVVLINTSDVLEGKILNKTPVDNKNLKGQFKKTFKKNDTQIAIATCNSSQKSNDL